MKRPCLLNADTVGVLSYCESLSNAAVLSLNNSSLENLNSLGTVCFNCAASIFLIMSFIDMNLLKVFDVLTRIFFSCGSGTSLMI